jgi:Sodium/calcium exchanger protein
VLITIEGSDLRLPMLYASVFGLVALALLLTFSSPDAPPRWHKALCAVGFVVAIAWISIIADEVVGILRAFGAILGVSEAILGVTVFAMVDPSHNPSDSRATRYPILLRTSPSRKWDIL